MTLSLRQFQNGFANALRFEASEPDAGAVMARLVSQPGFAVYRNTVMKGCVDALHANYPAVARLVGEEWFRAAAAEFAAANPPDRPALVDYGAPFPEFLDAFEPAAAVPYLADVARLDRFATHAHVSADAPVLAAAALAGLSEDTLARAVLQVHPSAQWRWFDAMPIYSIWRANHAADTAQPAVSIEWIGEGALLVRPQFVVTSQPLGIAGCAFLDACGRAEPLADVAEAALAADPDADLAALLERLLRAGAFTQIEFQGSSRQEAG